MSKCKCGCGEEPKTKGARFLPGHMWEYYRKHPGAFMRKIEENRGIEATKHLRDITPRQALNKIKYGFVFGRKPEIEITKQHPNSNSLIKQRVVWLKIKARKVTIKPYNQGRGEYGYMPDIRVSGKAIINTDIVFPDYFFIIKLEIG